MENVLRRMDDVVNSMLDVAGDMGIDAFMQPKEMKQYLLESDNPSRVIDGWRRELAELNERIDLLEDAVLDYREEEES